MRLAAGTLLLAFAIFLNSIELISSQPRTLEDLFPGYNGIIPPFEKVYSVRRWPNFETFDRRRMTNNFSVFFKRVHIIFGYQRNDLIEDPCRLFNQENVFIVFDTNINQWISVPRYLAWKLGAGRRLSLVLARDEVADTHKLTSTNPAYIQAHIMACKQANAQADKLEQEQDKLLTENQTMHYHSIAAIKEEYNETYTREFMLHLNRHGEYNLNEHREIHT